MALLITSCCLPTELGACLPILPLMEEQALAAKAGVLGGFSESREWWDQRLPWLELRSLGIVHVFCWPLFSCGAFPSLLGKVPWAKSHWSSAMLSSGGRKTRCFPPMLGPEGDEQRPSSHRYRASLPQPTQQPEAVVCGWPRGVPVTHGAGDTPVTSASFCLCLSRLSASACQ